MGSIPAKSVIGRNGKVDQNDDLSKTGFEGNLVAAFMVYKVPPKKNLILKEHRKKCLMGSLVNLSIPENPVTSNQWPGI